MKGWISPYRVVRASQRSRNGWGLFPSYCVEFEESILFEGLDYETARTFAAALNGAYNMGRTYEALRVESV